MAIPNVIAGADQAWEFTTLPKYVTLAGDATNLPILEWEWTMLYVPPGSVAATGVNGNFRDGVAKVQNPSFTCDLVGCYVLQIKARNVDGWSEPLVDQEAGQTAIYILTERYSIRLPGAFLWRYDGDLNRTLTDLEAAIYGSGVPPAVTPVNVTKSTASAGSGTTAARHDHKHDISTGTPVSIGVSNAEGSSSFLARADHVHAAGALSTFINLTDAPPSHSYIGQAGKVLVVNEAADGLEFGEGGAVADFTDLGDVPGAYTGQGGKSVKVKSTEDGLEFGDAAGTFVALTDGPGEIIVGSVPIGSAPEGEGDNYLSNIPFEFQFLDDSVPGPYTGNAGKYVRVNGDGDGLEYSDPPGGADRMLVFSDDTELSEAGTSWVTKKSFRIIRDADKPPTKWRFIVSLKTSGGVSEIAECRVQIVGAGVPEITPTMTGGSTSEVLNLITHTIDPTNEMTNYPITINIQLRKQGSGGTGVSLIYTDVYGIF